MAFQSSVMPPSSQLLFSPSVVVHPQPFRFAFISSPKHQPTLSTLLRSFQHHLSILRPKHRPLALASSGGNSSDNRNNNNGGDGGGGDDAGASDSDGDLYRREPLLVPAQAGKKLESLPPDLAAAVEGDITPRIVEMEGSPVFRWLLQFRGFRERLLADNLFLAKLTTLCGVGIIDKTAAEYEKRRENFFKEIDLVIADVVMAVVADFMFVYLPAPTVPLQPPRATNAGFIASIFGDCPDTAFQIALLGKTSILRERLGVIVRNGVKLFTVGSRASLGIIASLVDTGVTNALKGRKAVDKELDNEVEDIPVVSHPV